jgi:hypothetical protein
MLKVLTVKDLDKENVSLVQDDRTIEAFNEDYDQDYSFYFIENDEKLWGSYSLSLDRTAYYVGEI